MNKCSSDLGSKKNELDKCNADYRECSTKLGGLDTCNKNLKSCNEEKNKIASQKDQADKNLRLGKTNTLFYLSSYTNLSNVFQKN